MYVPVMQVRNSEVIVYDQWTGARRAPELQEENLKGAYSGTVTDGAIKRLKKCVSLLVQKSPKKWIYNPVVDKHHQFRIGFITLTIADQGKDTAHDVYKNCLEPWLRWGRRQGMTDYVWKAELQQRGEIHYHVATNVFLHYQDIQDYWNRLQHKARYLDKYAKEHGHFRPNSVDVHAVKKVKDIERYLTKYMTKNLKRGDPNPAINGKIWDASQNLKSANYFSTEMTPRNLELLHSNATKVIETEHCKIFRMPPDSPIYTLDNVQRKSYHSFIQSI